MVQPQILQRKEGLVYSFNIPMESSNQRHGNEQTDRLATHGAGQQQPENQVCLTEVKTIIKSLFKTPQQQYSYNQLTRSDHNNIFRLRTGHNRLNQHLNRVMKIILSSMCSRGEAEQDTAHILQTCKNHQAL